MIRKTKHPSNRGERLAIKVKKSRIHSNASPVYRLLKEKEDRDASRLPRDRDTSINPDS